MGDGFFTLAATEHSVKGGQTWQLAELSPSSFLTSFDTNELVCWLFSTYGLKGSLRNVVDSSCSVY